MIYYIKSTGYIFWNEKPLKSLTFRRQFPQMRQMWNKLDNAYDITAQNLPPAAM